MAGIGVPSSLSNFYQPILERADRLGYGQTTTQTHPELMVNALTQQANLELGIAQLKTDTALKSAQIISNNNIAQQQLSLETAKFQYMKDMNTPSFGERLMGVATGALSGYVTGGNMTQGDTTGKIVGAVAGGALAYAGSGTRQGQSATMDMLGKVADLSQLYRQQKNQEAAAAGTSTMLDQLRGLNHATQGAAGTPLAGPAAGGGGGQNLSNPQPGANTDPAAAHAQKMAILDNYQAKWTPVVGPEKAIAMRQSLEKSTSDPSSPIENPEHFTSVQQAERKAQYDQIQNPTQLDTKKFMHDIQGIGLQSELSKGGTPDPGLGNRYNTWLKEGQTLKANEQPAAPGVATRYVGPSNPATGPGTKITHAPVVQEPQQESPHVAVPQVPGPTIQALGPNGQPTGPETPLGGGAAGGAAPTLGPITGPPTQQAGVAGAPGPVAGPPAPAQEPSLLSKIATGIGRAGLDAIKTVDQFVTPKTLSNIIQDATNAAQGKSGGPPINANAGNSAAAPADAGPAAPSAAQPAGAGTSAPADQQQQNQQQQNQQQIASKQVNPQEITPPEKGHVVPDVVNGASIGTVEHAINVSAPRLEAHVEAQLSSPQTKLDKADRSRREGLISSAQYTHEMSKNMNDLPFEGMQKVAARAYAANLSPASLLAGVAALIPGGAGVIAKGVIGAGAGEALKQSGVTRDFLESQFTPKQLDAIVKVAKAQYDLTSSMIQAGSLSSSDTKVTSLHDYMNFTSGVGDSERVFKVNLLTTMRDIDDTAHRLSFSFSHPDVETQDKILSTKVHLMEANQKAQETHSKLGLGPGWASLK